MLAVHSVPTAHVCEQGVALTIVKMPEWRQSKLYQSLPARTQLAPAFWGGAGAARAPE